MSAQFIHANNQSMLWKVINNTPQTISYFANAPLGEKERWFQSIIGNIYNQYNGKNISLKDMNKRAIDFMLQSLMPAVPSVPLSSVPLSSVPLSSVPLSREQQMHEQFSRRQAEYESMVKGPMVPTVGREASFKKETPVPHFTGGVKDEAILDLSSAVKEYMKQRDQDIEIPKGPMVPTVGREASFKPESISRDNEVPRESLSKASQSAPKAPSRSVASNDAPKRLNLQNAEPISLTVEELPTKKVQWGENTEYVFDKNESISRGDEVPREGASAYLLQKDISEIKTKLDLIIGLLRTKE